MKGICHLVAVLCLFSTACEKSTKRIKIEESRGPSTRDVAPKLFATSDERFRNVLPSPIKDTAPEGWLALPAAQFRETNYRFGESGLGEVYASLTGGSIADNANRWMRQIGQEPLTTEEVENLEKTVIAGVEGIVLEASGTYSGAMGGEDRPGYGLAGVIGQINGKIITVKMVGPEAEVELEKEKLKVYAASLSLAK